MTAKLTYEYVKSQIESKGYTLISTEYKRASEKLELMCPNGHHFYIKYNNFQQGQGCCHCYEDNHGFTYEHVKLKVEECGFELITKKEEYVNTRTKLKIK